MLKDKFKKLISDPKVQKAVKEKVIPFGRKLKREEQINRNPKKSMLRKQSFCPFFLIFIH